MARSVKEIEEKTLLYNTANHELKDRTAEAEKLKACLEGAWCVMVGIVLAVTFFFPGRFKSGVKASPTKTQFCSPCSKLHEARLVLVTQKQVASAEGVQREMARLKRVLDKGIEAKDLAERFLDREKEMRAELDQTKRDLLKVKEDLSQTKYLVQNKHDMTEKCKHQVKVMERKCADFEVVNARVKELEKSVMQVLLRYFRYFDVKLTLICFPGFSRCRSCQAAPTPNAAR